MRKKRKIFLGRVTVLSVAIALFLTGMSIAGSLEPSAAPAPTMKTLDKIPPTWNQMLQCDITACPRFESVMGGAALLDKETGLVWQKTLSTSTYTWLNAQFYCSDLSLGGRKGWRLPSAQELMSLIDTTVPSPGLTLPSGHFFDNVMVNYWTASTAAFDSTLAWNVGFDIGDVWTHPKTQSWNVWCVRGGRGVNPQ